MDSRLRFVITFRYYIQQMIICLKFNNSRIASFFVQCVIEESLFKTDSNSVAGFIDIKFFII